MYQDHSAVPDNAAVGQCGSSNKTNNILATIFTGKYEPTGKKVEEKHYGKVFQMSSDNSWVPKNVNALMSSS